MSFQPIEEIIGRGLKDKRVSCKFIPSLTKENIMLFRLSGLLICLENFSKRFFSCRTNPGEITRHVKMQLVGLNSYANTGDYSLDLLASKTLRSICCYLSFVRSEMTAAIFFSKSIWHDSESKKFGSSLCHSLSVASAF